MVQICIDEWEDMRKARKDNAGELTDVEKELLGRNVRLEFPIRDLTSAKMAADLLIGLGNQIKLIAGFDGMDKASKLMIIRSHVHSVRDRMRVVNGLKGRKYDKIKP